MEDDDFCEEIQDIGNAQTNTHLEEGKLLFVQTGTKMEWLRIRKKDRESVQNHTCYFGINHSMRLNDHHLYVVDVISEDDQPQELVPCEAEDKKGDETAQSSIARMVLQRKRPHYYDKQQQLELVLAAQRLLGAGEHDFQSTNLDEEEECGADSRSSEYGKMSAAWNCCKEERCLLLLILWNQKGQGRGYSIITGRGSHCTSKGYWCQDQRIAWD
jgi:hypothetical protein